MRYLLLLVNADGIGTAQELIVREFRAYPGDEGISVHFRPVRNDALFQSAKVGSEVAYRVLLGEGRVRSQVWVEYEVRGPAINVVGRSGDLLFAIALLSSRWTGAAGEYPVIAATGVLDTDEALVRTDCARAVTGVDRIEAKLGAAVEALAGERKALIFYPSADQARVEAWLATTAVPPHIRIQPVATLEDALSTLGIQLEKVYLGNPYRGLESFDYAHRSVFFGRECEIREITAQLLRRERAGTPGVLVEGASGSGKSSFLRAGVLPALIHPRAHSPELERGLADRPVPESAAHSIWHPALVAAGADERFVARSILRVWQRLPELQEHRVADLNSFEALLGLWHASWPGSRRFVWVVDQLEELISLGLDESVIESFGRFLLCLQAYGAWSLASVRADAVPLLKRCAALRRVFGANEGQYYLPGLGPTALDEVICRPAKAAKLTFATDSGGKSLDRVLREDAYRDHENALPLLQLTLHELYRRRNGRELTYTDYEQLGGLSGAVAAIASAALMQAPQGTVAVASRLFRALVTVDESGNARRRYVLRTEIAEDPAQEQLLSALVNARLCVSDQRDGRAVVALAHEAVLRTWPELVDWLREESRLLQLRELAEHDARQWQQHDHADTWLAPASKLAALEPLENAGVRLSEPVSDFIRHSRRRMCRTTRLKRVSVSAIVLLAIAASVTGLIAISKQRDAQYQAARALRARDQATISAATARATANFLSAIFNAPTPESSLGKPITARELLDAGARRLQTSLVAAPEVRAELTEQIGNAYREIGEYDRAGPLLNSAIHQYRLLVRAPPEDRATAYTALGQFYLATGQWPSATKDLKRAVELETDVPAARRSALPNIVYAHIETHEAHFLAARRALDEAREILSNRKETPDQENYLLLIGYSQLSLDQGRLAKAEQFGLEALQVESRILGRDDPSAIGASLRLADVYLASGDAVMAEKYDGHAMVIAKRIYGLNNPVYAKTLEAYATDRHYLGKNKDAERLLRRVLQIRLRTLGANHRLTAQAYLNLGSTLTYEGRWREGLIFTRRALKIFESSEGHGSPDAAFTLTAEARILVHLGRAAEAVPVALRALHASQNPSRTDQAATVWEWLQLGKAYAALGRSADAAHALHHAIDVYEAIYGGTGKPLARMLDAYARALEGEGRVSAARAALAVAAEIRSRNQVARVPTLNLQPN